MVVGISSQTADTGMASSAAAPIAADAVVCGKTWLRPVAGTEACSGIDEDTGMVELDEPAIEVEAIDEEQAVEVDAAIEEEQAAEVDAEAGAAVGRGRFASGASASGRGRLTPVKGA